MASVEEMKSELQALIDQANELAAAQSDAVQFASQTGRLDFLSAVLAVLSIVLAVGGVFAFIEVRGRAKRAAEETARNACIPIAEELVLAYINEELPDEIRRHVETLVPQGVENVEQYGLEDDEQNQS